MELKHICTNCKQEYIITSKNSQVLGVGALANIDENVLIVICPYCKTKAIVDLKEKK